MLYLIITITFLSTLLGGFVGLKYHDRLHLILGFTAGVLLAVVSFDLFPEIITIVNIQHIDSVKPMIFFVLAFLLFHISEKVLLIHKEGEGHYGEHTHPTLGILSASALTLHSFLDGVGIGLGFQVSTTVGILIAIAVIAHDFSDGLNTVTLTLINKNTKQIAIGFLLADATAPVLGALSTKLYSLPDNILVLYLGFFSGFLLYIATSEILPEAHSKHPSTGAIFMTMLGVLFIFAVTRII